MTTRSYATLDTDGKLTPIQTPEGGGVHPGVLAHELMGLATDTDLSALVATLATALDLVTHAATPHGLSSHALDGAYHTGTAVLPTDGQKNALAGTQGTPGTLNPYVTTQDPRLSDARTPASHSHGDGDLPAGLARDAEVAAAYQPLDTDLTAIAAMATTAFGRGLLALADAAALAAAHTHGGAASPWTVEMKNADESKNNAAVVADDSELTIPLLANTNYAIRLVAFWLTNATADLKYRLVFTGTTTRLRRRIQRTSTTDVATVAELKTAFDAADVVMSTTGLNPWLDEEIVLQVGASGGNLKLQWGQVAANAGPTTCLEGSYIEYAIT